MDNQRNQHHIKPTPSTTKAIAWGNQWCKNTTTCENQQYKQPPYVMNTARWDDKRDEPTLVETLLNKRIINFQGCLTSSHNRRHEQ